MDVKEELDRIHDFVLKRTGKRLVNTDKQRDILQGAWEGKTHDEIAAFYNLNRSTSVETFKKMCELLSEAFGEEVEKRNFREVIERTWRSQLYGKISCSEESVAGKVQQSELDPIFVGRNCENTNPRQNWREALDISSFKGRTEELVTLEQWIVNDCCRLVAIWGMPGIGKSSLARKLADKIKDNFEYVIWRSLSHAPPVQDILVDLIQFLASEQETVLPDTVVGCISRLIECLQAHRCLVVLDGVETLLGAGQLAGKYREGYQEYGRLFKQVGESNHQSSIVLTSSEKSREITLLEGNTRPVRSYKLKGLKKQAAQEILREIGLVEEDEWGSFIERYGANPLHLKIVSAMVIELFDGKASEFLRQNTVFIGRIDEVLDQQFERLSDLEIKVMCQLAIAHQPVPLDQLREDISLSISISTSELLTALESLTWRALIEKITEGGEVPFTLQPVVRKYVINRFSLSES